MLDFLDRYHIPNLNKDYVNYLNISISTKEIKVAVKSLPKRLGYDPLVQNFIIIKEELISILHKLLHK